MFVACGIWCLADVSSVSPSPEQTINQQGCTYLYEVFFCGKVGCKADILHISPLLQHTEELCFL